MQFSHDQGGLIGFGTAVRKVALLQATWCNLGKLLGKLHNRLIDVERGGMLHLLHLRLNGGIDLGLAMTNAHREYTTEEVQVGAAFGVPDAHAFSTFHNQRFTVIGIGTRPNVLFFLGDGVALRLRCSCVLLLMGWK